MTRRHGWLIALVLAALLVAACGPQMATPTVKAPEGNVTPTNVADGGPTQVVPTAAPTATSVEPVDVAKLPVDPADWHALGAADAKVTIVEYSDFQ
jgi:protein-disulfide isomerase